MSFQICTRLHKGNDWKTLLFCMLNDVDSTYGRRWEKIERISLSSKVRFDAFCRRVVGICFCRDLFDANYLKFLMSKNMKNA